MISIITCNTSYVTFSPDIKIKEQQAIEFVLTCETEGHRLFLYRMCTGDPSSNVSLLKSNHQPCITEHLPSNLSTRTSGPLSFSKEEFDKASHIYNDALRTSGFSKSITFTPKGNRKKRNTRKNRKRKIVWYNLPYSENVQTNVAKSFQRLLNKHFPKSNIMHKLFDRNNVKVSYSCMPNMASIVKQHNKKILNQHVNATPSDGCNGRVKHECTLHGSCHQSSVVYQAAVNASAETLV